MTKFTLAMCGTLFATALFFIPATAQMSSISADDMHRELLAISQQELGVSAEPGPETNARIIEYFDALSYEVTDDETNWCSAFAAFVAVRAGFDVSGVSVAARSWSKLGRNVDDDPHPGDVAVFWREDPLSWKGHVGYVVEVTEKSVLVIGGNQRGAVSKVWFDREEKVLGFRRLEPVDYR